MFSEIQRKITADKPTFNITYLGALVYGRRITHLIWAAYQANIKLILSRGINRLYRKEPLEEAFSYADYRGILDHQEVVEALKEAKAGVWQPCSR